MEFLLRAIASFAAGWILYMIVMAMTVYDGCLSLLFQPIMACAFSGAFTGAALAVGQALRVPALGRRWSNNPGVALAVATVGLCCFFVGCLAQGSPEGDASSEVRIKWGYALPAYAGYFLVLFAIANWPVRRKAVEAPL